MERYGWKYRRSDEKTWETGWSCDRRSYPMKIDICDTWITFEISPLLPMELEWMDWPELTTLLLELNHSIHFVKLALTETGEVSLSAQVFSNQLDYDSFHDTVGVLGHYAEILFEKLMNHAIDIGAFGPSNQSLPA